MRNILTCHQLSVYARICQTLCNWWQEVCQRWRCHYRAAVCSDKEINQRLLENRGNLRFCERSVHSVVSLLWASDGYSLLIGSEAPTDSFWYCWKKEKHNKGESNWHGAFDQEQPLPRFERWGVGEIFHESISYQTIASASQRWYWKEWLRRFLAQSLCTIWTDTVGQLARDLPLAQYIPEFP